MKVSLVALSPPLLVGVEVSKECIAAADDGDPFRKTHRPGEITDVFPTEFTLIPRLEDLLRFDRLGAAAVDNDVAVDLEHP